MIGATTQQCQTRSSVCLSCCPRYLSFALVTSLSAACISSISWPWSFVICLSRRTSTPDLGRRAAAEHRSRPFNERPPQLRQRGPKRQADGKKKNMGVARSRRKASQTTWPPPHVSWSQPHPPQPEPAATPADMSIDICSTRRLSASSLVAEEFFMCGSGPMQEARRGATGSSWAIQRTPDVGRACGRWPGCWARPKTVAQASAPGGWAAWRVVLQEME